MLSSYRKCNPIAALILLILDDTRSKEKIQAAPMLMFSCNIYIKKKIQHIQIKKLGPPFPCRQVLYNLGVLWSAILKFQICVCSLDIISAFNVA